MATFYLVAVALLLTASHGTSSSCVCPALYRPVCCKTWAGSTTLSNSCQCDCAGGTVTSEGSCPKLPVPCICGLLYSPVCCQTGETFASKGNPCECRCGGGKMVEDKKCVSEPSCICTAQFDPVCCKVNGMLMTKSNNCVCTCAGGIQISKGECRSTPSAPPSPTATPFPTATPAPAPACAKCSRHARPVCCFTKRRHIRLVSKNPCSCRCRGGLPKRLSLCRRPKCLCTRIYRPVCCKL